PRRSRARAVAPTCHGAASWHERDYRHSPKREPSMTVLDPPTFDCAPLVLFGATGDLARRMLWPSLYALDHDGLLPADFRVIGAAHSQWSAEDFRAKVRDAIQASANAALFDDATLERV